MRVGRLEPEDGVQQKAVLIEEHLKCLQFSIRSRELAWAVYTESQPDTGSSQLRISSYTRDTLGNVDVKCLK